MKNFTLRRFSKIALAVVLAAIAVMSFSFSATGIFDVRADLIEVDTGAAETYKLNDAAVFPESVEVTYNDSEYTAGNGVLTRPDGEKLLITDSSFILDMLGKYTLSYYFKADGVNVTATDDFTVVQSKFGFSDNNGSSVIMVDEQSQEVCENNDDDVLYTGETGAIVRINNGSKFVYNEPVDLSAGSYGSLRSVIKIDPRPYNISYNAAENKYDYNYTIAEQIVVRITDCYDSLNYVELLIDASKEVGAGSIYLRAAQSNEAAIYYGNRLYPTDEPTAWLGDKEYYMDGERGIAYTEYGVYYSINALYPATDALEILYDSDRDRLYYRSQNSVVFILDLANEYLFGDNAFKGFATEEVYISIEGKNYKAAEPARVDILSVGGEPVETAENMDYVDVTDPKIDIQIDKTDDNGVYIAKGEKFVIPQAEVTDCNYAGDLSVRVYRNYMQANQLDVSVTDGAFTVSQTDRYTVVYTAKDTFGNETTETLEVIGVGAENSIMIDVEELEKIYFGETTTLPEHTVTTLNDENALTVSIKAVCGENVIEIDPETRQFTPTELGKYTIIYTLKDNACEREFSYEADVEGREDVVFMSAPAVPEYMIKDATYRIEQLNAMVKGSDGNYTETEAELMVSFDGGEYTAVSDLDKCKITGSEEVRFKFVCQGKESAVSSAQIIDVGYGSDNEMQLYKYFQGDFTVQTRTDEGQVVDSITYDSNVLSGNNVLTFINHVSYKSFGLNYNIPEGKDNFSKVNIRLVNPSDEDDYLTLTVEKSNENAVVSFEGGARKVISVDFSGLSSIDIGFEYDRRRVTVNGQRFDFYETLDSELAVLEIELEGITGASSITVSEVGNTSFNNWVTADTYKPEFWINRSLGRYNPGDVVEIFSPVYSDVLSPLDYSTLKVTVQKEGGGYLKTTDGVLLDGSQEYAASYLVEVTEYGSYMVQYEISDGHGNSSGKNQYRFSVTDNVAPEITFDNLDENSIVTVKANEVYEIKYSVSDNFDDADKLKVRINILDNDFQSLDINVSNKVTFAEKGLYTVYVYCADSTGNSTYRYFFIEVK